MINVIHELGEEYLHFKYFESSCETLVCLAFFYFAYKVLKKLLEET